MNVDVKMLIDEARELFEEEKYTEAIKKANQAWNGITNKNTQIPEQIKIQDRLGGCYLEQARKTKDADKADKRFGQAVKHHQKQLQLAEQLEDEQAKIQKQIDAQTCLGRCYLEQGKKTKDTDKADKRFGQAVAHYQKLLQLTEHLEDGRDKIREQIDAQSSFGRCYLEQARKTKDTDKADKRFGQAIEHFRKQLQLLEQLEGEPDEIYKQSNTQLWLGHCYFEQAKKTKDADKADERFGQAVAHYQKWLQLTEQLEGEQDKIWQQINAQSWLGRCYLEQAKKTKDADKADERFGQAVAHYQKWLQLTEQLEGEQDKIWQQINAQSWLGRCYLEQAKKTKDADKADERFGQAVAHYRKWLQLTEQLEGELDKIWQQIYAQYWLVRCYIERVKRSKNTNNFKDLACQYFSNIEGQLSQLSDEAAKTVWKKRIRQDLRAVAYFKKEWDSYFDKKKQEIQESLFQGKTSQPQDAVATILAVLHISPIELGFTPMAHYTSPHVCHILFGIGGKETASPMRLGSSTYMNDPSEGKVLLDLLNQQDLELENKADGESHNAFFTCFSSRVNDLNQFRLYGKEGGVEASGCCLVFNKNGDWLREADVSVPFRSLSEKSGKDSDDLPEAVFSDNEYEKLPLYQVAYIAYQDEYIAEKKCGIWLSASNKAFDLHQNLVQENSGSSIRFKLNANINRFGIRLKPVGNEDWHRFRLEKLKEALEELIGFFKDKSAVSDEDKEALEYIRYLFKDFAFRDEEEFRLLVIKPIDSKEIQYCKDTKSVYIPYANIQNQVDEVILGTNYEKTGNQRKAEVFRYQMKQKCPDVKVSRSTLPINPPNK